MEKKHALITGITGQDGSYLAELLLEKGYEVFGIMRRKSVVNYGNVEHIKDKIHFIYADMTDIVSLQNAMQISQADEVYNLAAQSFVGTSWEQPLATAEIDAIGVTNMLEAVKAVKPSAHFYQAATSEMFGKVQEMPQTEKTPFYPRSPYGVTKLYAFWITKNYRESFHMFACNGILFNHESERRGLEFVTRKITNAAARIKYGLQDCIELESFKHIGIELMWEGTGINEVGKDKETGKILVKVNPKFFRPAEVEILLGNPAKAEKELGWRRQVCFSELVERMIKNDLEIVEKEIKAGNV